MTWTPETVDAVRLSAVAYWNVYGLPALLAVVSVVSLARSQRRDGGAELDAPSAWTDRRLMVRRIGLMHYGLAFWSLTTVADEFWAARDQGFSHANPITVVAALATALIDIPLGAGLRRFRPGARWAALGFAAVRWTLAVWVTMIVGQSGGTFDPTEWPRFAAARVTPAFELLALLLPATARVFQTRGADGPNAESGLVDRLLALGSRLFLVVVVSAAATDALDWAVRAAVEMSAGGSGGPAS